ncbi:hypothetical protein ACN9MN_17910 [Chryseobacterium sp. S-02]|uniref:hypothetical protein n=1 Tax=Chryseobacterium sp. S-02 TaxID=3404064 RepID=UPI003CF45497
MKNLIVLIVILFSKLLFSQASASAQFNLTIYFEKDIPVEKLQTYCYSKAGNAIKTVEVKIDKENNSIILTGTNHFVIPVSFPVLYFSYTDKVRINDQTKQELERNNIFYLVSGFSISSYDEDKNRIIKFSKEKPNILITSKIENGKKILNIENFKDWDVNHQHFKENLDISNTSLKLN